MSTTTGQDIIPNYHMLIRKDILPLIPKMGGTLLDVGGGVGATAALLKKSGYVEKAGVVDLVIDEARSLDLNFRYAVNLDSPDALDKVFVENGPFSIILCLDVLEHLVDPWSLIKRLHAMLEPNGIVVASIPNIRYYRASFPLFFQGKWELEDSGIRDRTHLRWFVKKTAKELMGTSGMALELCISKRAGGRRVRLFQKLTFGLFDDFTSIQFLIRARNVSLPPIFRSSE